MPFYFQVRTPHGTDRQREERMRPFIWPIRNWCTLISITYSKLYHDTYTSHSYFTLALVLPTSTTSSVDSHVFQDDLDNLMCWSDKWKLGFNPQKCKTMHVGHSVNTEYKMTTQGKVWKLDETKEERDLCVIIIVTNNLKPSQQCTKAASKARSILVWIKRQFGSLSKNEFLILYKTYVRPHGILYSDRVAIPTKKHQLLGKCPAQSNKDGSWTQGRSLWRTIKSPEIVGEVGASWWQQKIFVFFLPNLWNNNSGVYAHQ